MDINRLINNVKALNFRHIVEDSLEATKHRLVQLQRLQMLMGERSDGKKIGPRYRSIPYALQKQASNPLAGFRVPDLRVTGAFHRGIFAYVDNGKVIFGSNDEKANDLMDKYPLIMGLNKKNRAEYSKTYLPPEANRRIIKQIRK